MILCLLQSNLNKIKAEKYFHLIIYFMIIDQKESAYLIP